MNKLVVSNIRLPINHNESDILNKLHKEGISAEFNDLQIIKKSIDARDKSDIRYVYSFALDSEFKKIKKLTSKCSYKEITEYKVPVKGNAEAKNRHVIVGAGPAGLFAGLILARNGYKPLIIERGEKVEERTKSVETFWHEGKLNTRSNVCFGEGGAGTFSDGKLTTGVKNTNGRLDFVLNEFVKAGADEEIRYWYKPHIGSDKLVNVVKNIRNEIISLGGEFKFNTTLVDFDKEDALKLKVEEAGKLNTIFAETLILATGHSARDIYKLMYNKNAEMTSKAFAVGFRIEHPSELIQIAQFGTNDKSYLPVADYKLSYNTNSGRGIYSFCMCPGGYVVNSSTENDGICINGMSLKARDGKNSNSAIIATVNEKDFGSDLFDGVKFQEQIEKTAYASGDSKIPVSTYGDFKGKSLCASLGNILPDIKGEYKLSNLSEIFNESINNDLVSGIESFEKAVKGFSDDNAVLSGVESRTSSPIKIFRDENFESNIKGVFPCGEGAGYAGGITSAAMDGIKVAEEIIRRYKS